MCGQLMQIRLRRATAWGFIINYEQDVPKWANIAILNTPTNLHTI